MYTVKKFKKGETIFQIDLSEIKKLKWQAKRDTWVVMNDGKPHFAQNEISGKPELESYYQKSTAEAQADWLNKQQ